MRDETGFFVTQAGLPGGTKATDLRVVNVRDKELEPRKITHSADKIVLNYLRHFSTQSHPTPTGWSRWRTYTVQQMRQVFDFVDTEAFQKAPKRLGVV